MGSLLIRNAQALVTMDERCSEIPGGKTLVENDVIAGLGTEFEGDEIIDARGCVVTLGLVNTYHCLYQPITRVVPRGQDAMLSCDRPVLRRDAGLLLRAGVVSPCRVFP